MNEYNPGGSQSGSIEPRRERPGLAGIFDWDPFRSMLTGNWQQIFGIDINRKDDGYEIEMPVPGFRPEDLDITYQDGVLTVSGRNEKRNFSRSLSLPDDVDEDRIEARVEHGVLCLTVKQHPKQQPKRITVTSGPQTTTGTIDATSQSSQTTQTSK